MCQKYDDDWEIDGEVSEVHVEPFIWYVVMAAMISLITNSAQVDISDGAF